MNRKKIIGAIVIIVVLIAGIVTAQMRNRDLPYGSADDVKFAEQIWSEMKGYSGWTMKSDILPGHSPHGEFIRMYDNVILLDGVNYHVVAKDNYTGQNLTLGQVEAAPSIHIGSVTVMVQREPGYDPDNQNWFWVIYSTDGKILADDNGVPMAGRVAKGSPTGCIACHSRSQGGDFFFSND